MKSSRYLRYLKFLVAFLIVTAGVMICNQTLDNDSWYTLAEGREIVENGIYYTDELSMHSDFNVTVQNYGFATIFYFFYSAFGGVGIYVIMLALNGILLLLIYKVCFLISDRNENLSIIIAVLTDLLLSYGFVVTRAQMMSYVFLMLVIYLLELYARQGNKKALWWIPVLSLMQINLHASLWPMILIVVAVYIIDGFKQPRLHYKGYTIEPLLAVFGASFLAGFLNPYGIKMMTFIFTSYGVSEANDFIEELQPFRSLGSSYNILLFSTIVLVMILYIFGKNRNVRLRYLILTFGFLALGLNTVKGMSHLILVLLFPMAEVYKDIKIVRWRKQRIAMVAWGGVLAIFLIVSSATIVVPSVRQDGPSKLMIMGMDVLDETVGDTDKDNLKVYSNFNEGGFVEYRGYRSYIDPRMEVFVAANNGKEEIFKEFYDLQFGAANKQDFLEKYDFDYLVIREYDVLYDSVDENDYEVVFDDDAGNDDGIRIYRKIKNIEGGVKI